MDRPHHLGQPIGNERAGVPLTSLRSPHPADNIPLQAECADSGINRYDPRTAGHRPADKALQPVFRATVKARHRRDIMRENDEPAAILQNILKPAIGSVEIVLIGPQVPRSQIIGIDAAPVDAGL